MELLDILALTVENLQGKLTELGLQTDGTKTILQARLIKYYQNFNTRADADSEYGEAASVIRQTDVIEEAWFNIFLKGQRRFNFEIFR